MKTIYFVTARVFSESGDRIDTAKGIFFSDSQDSVKREAIANIVRAKLPDKVSVEITEIESVPDVLIYESLFERVSPSGEKVEMTMERASNGQVQITVKGKEQYREALDLSDGARLEISIDEI